VCGCRPRGRSPSFRLWTADYIVLYLHNPEYWFVRILSKAWCVVRGALELRPRMPMGCRPELDPAVVGSVHALQQVRSIELHQYATGGNLVIPGTVLFCVFVRLGCFFGCALTRLSFFLPPCFVPFSLCLFLFFIDAVLPLFRVLVPIMSDCLTYHILSKGIVINSWCWLQLVRGLTKNQKRVL